VAKFGGNHLRKLGDPGLKKMKEKTTENIRKQGSSVPGGLKSIYVVPRQTNRISIANMC